jgi:hypothetical protein
MIEVPIADQPDIGSVMSGRRRLASYTAGGGQQ